MDKDTVTSATPQEPKQAHALSRDLIEFIDQRACDASDAEKIKLFFRDLGWLTLSDAISNLKKVMPHLLEVSEGEEKCH